GDRARGGAMVAAARHPEPRTVGPPPVVLQVEPAGRVRVARDLVDALAELGEGIGHEAGAEAPVGRGERRAAVLAQVVSARRDAEVDATPVTQDGVHAEPAVPGAPLSRVRVVADAGNHLPG